MTISPGFTAFPSGKFSQVGTTIIIFKGRFNSPTVFITPKTVAAPPISYFISSISVEGLIDIPPASNVIPFPTRTIGFLFFGPLLCSTIINLGASLLPLATDRKDPILNFSICFCSKTVTFILYARASFFAELAR